ncbi:MFS transporter [Aeromicrobium sp. CTD01-1L150]|uniref:MFS transporter n=1 Tax=Aeromicrobium sp. CTD01-1L150 TaxID=3341830 RepID=UPI0035C1282B
MRTTSPNRWLMLAVGMVGQAAGTVFVNAAPFLIPYLHLQEGVPLAQAGALASAPLLGTTLSLVLWGVVVDRVGERATLTLGLGIVSLAAVGAAFTTSYVALAVAFFLGGLGVASTNSASGRLVVGWFPPRRRGTAMGIRQTALPLGVGIAALLVPTLIERTDLRTTMLVVAAGCIGATLACALLVVDPPRAGRTEAAGLGQLDNPYRAVHDPSRRLLRIHVASALLVVPQFTVWVYMLIWLVDAKDWSTAAAGALVAATQLLGAAGRIGAGWWSDRVGSRMRPMRTIAVAAAVTMLALALLEGTALGITLMVVATVVTVADNGLAFTAVAETGGPYWSGKALGVQNTGQYLVSAGVPPLVGVVIAQQGYSAAFAAAAVLPLLAVPLIPVARRAAAASS